MTYGLINLLYDAHDGDVMDNLAARFGLSVESVERVVEAMLPAFSIGLKHNTANPLSLIGFLNALNSGRHIKYYANPMAAFAPTRRHEEDVILGHLLGSKQVSRAVADQVEATTGVATAVIREMLPAVAAILMGGLAREAPRSPFTAPAEAFVEGFARGRPEPRPDDSLLDAVGAFFQGFGRGRDEEADEEADDSAPASGEDLFGDLFEPGFDIQRRHLLAITEIFEKFYGEDVDHENDD